MIIHLIVGLIKKNCQMNKKMSQYFPKPYRSFGGNINVKVNLSNYATKSDLKMQQELIHLNLKQNPVQLV